MTPIRVKILNRLGKYYHPLPGMTVIMHSNIKITPMPHVPRLTYKHIKVLIKYCPHENFS